MAKGSLTALQSVVSLMSMNRLRTVMTVRLNTVGCEKLFLPISIILLCAASIAFTAAALGTPGWVELRLYDTMVDDEVVTFDVECKPPETGVTSDIPPCPESKGSITFGIFRGTDDFERPNIGRLEQSTYYTFEEYEGFNWSKMFGAFGVACVSMLLSIVTIGLGVFNSYQTVTTWWRGPSALYVFCLLTGLFGLIAVGIFTDFVIWDLHDGATALLSVRHETRNLKDDGYISLLTVRYSIGLLILGALLPLIGVLLAWRMVVHIPNYEDTADDTLGQSNVFAQPPMKMEELPKTTPLDQLKNEREFHY